MTHGGCVQLLMSHYKRVRQLCQRVRLTLARDMADSQQFLRVRWQRQAAGLLRLWMDAHKRSGGGFTNDWEFEFAFYKAADHAGLGEPFAFTDAQTAAIRQRIERLHNGQGAMDEDFEFFASIESAAMELDNGGDTRVLLSYLQRAMLPPSLAVEREAHEKEERNVF